MTEIGVIMRYGYSKYHNIKVVIDGIKFDSKKEGARFLALKDLEKAGAIKDLELQRRFEIVPKKNNNRRARFYVADFVYTENGRKIIEDVKSPITRTNPVYSLKKAIMLAEYPEYEFREV